MSIQLAGFDCMCEVDRGRDLTQFWIRRVLIKLELRNRDGERRRLRFVRQPLHQNLRREKCLIEDDSIFLVGRPILRRMKNQFFVRAPRPSTANLWLEPDTLE